MFYTECLKRSPNFPNFQFLSVRVRLHARSRAGECSPPMILIDLWLAAAGNCFCLSGILGKTLSLSGPLNDIDPRFIPKDFTHFRKFEFSLFLYLCFWGHEKKLDDSVSDILRGAAIQRKRNKRKFIGDYNILKN